MKKPIETAAEHVGGFAELARIVGVKPPAVHQWRESGVPAGRCLAVEAATGGAITRYDLRPDVFGPAPESQAA